MPLLYWALEDIQQTQIPGGFTVVTKTDVASHQWLRHTERLPQKHAKPVERRGLIISWDARFCFVAFDDLEQDEDGDTFTHTFTWLGWVDCMTRYFYFWATNAGEKMKSTSCIFSKHFTWVPVPVTRYYYTDPHPETVCVDGHARRRWPNATWDNILHSAGTHAYSETDGALVDFTTYTTPNTYYQNTRAIMLFDTRELPAGKEIVSADIELVTLSKGMTPGFGIENLFKVNIVSSFPLLNTTIQTADYLRTGFTLMSDSITWANWAVAEQVNIFPLNEAGLARITPEGISRFALKEVTFDIGSVAPPWDGARTIHVQFRTAESIEDEFRPRLKVVYYE